MWRGFGQQVAPEPPAPPADFADRFTADFQATFFGELGRLSQVASESVAYQNMIDTIYPITGRKLGNPSGLEDGPARENADKMLHEGWAQALELDPRIGPMPDPRQQAVEYARGKVQRSMEMSAASVGFGGIGGFLGATSASMVHPYQIVGAVLPFGAAAKPGQWALNTLREGVAQGIGAAVVQAPIEVEAAPWRQRVGIEQSSLSNIGQAAAGGLVLGSGFRAIGEVARALAGRGRTTGYTGRDWYPAVETAARDGGVNPAYLSKVAMIESSGMNVRPKGPGQTASGLFGFTDGTWRSMGGDLADKGDIATQAEVMSRFTAVNRDTLRRTLGREPTDLELYAAHHFDPSIAAKMAEAPDSTPMLDLVGQRAVEANPYLDRMTVGGWKERFARKLGDEYAPRGRPPTQDEQDLVRTVDRAARDVDDAHGPPEAATTHMANMREAERSIIDGTAPKIEPLPEGAGVRRLAAPSGREADVQHELVELSSIWDDGPTGKSDRPVIGQDNKVEAGGDAVAALRGGDAQAQARQFEMARELGLETAGYVQPVVVDRRVGNMGDAERAQWMRDWYEPPAPASEMARGLSGPDRADLAVAEQVSRQAEEQGVSIGDVIASGEPVTPGAMRFLRAMTQDDAMRVRADPAEVPARVREAARARGAGGRGPALDVGAAQPPLVERAIQAVTEQTEQALTPEAVKAVEMNARRDIADALMGGRSYNVDAAEKITAAAASLKTIRPNALDEALSRFEMSELIMLRNGVIKDIEKKHAEFLEDVLSLETTPSDTMKDMIFGESGIARIVRSENSVTVQLPEAETRGQVDTVRALFASNKDKNIYIQFGNDENAFANNVSDFNAMDRAREPSPIGDQKVDIGDGRQVALDDVDAELRRLERMDEAADVIDAACLGIRVAKAAE